MQLSAVVHNPATKRLGCRPGLAIEDRRLVRRASRTAVIALVAVTSWSAAAPSAPARARAASLGPGPEKGIAGQHSRRRKVFRRVPLSSLVGRPGGVSDDWSLPFSWALQGHPGIIDGPPTADQRLLRVKTNRCRSVHLDFVAGGLNQSAWIAVVQAGRPSVSASTTYSYLGTLDAKLTPGRSWTLLAATPASSLDVYVNGYADCYPAPKPAGRRHTQMR